MVEIQLDDEQQRVVTSDSRAIVVVAGAGCGKTEVVSRRVERVLAASPDDAFRVLALSYTVKVADELRDRLQERLGDLHRRADTDTIHGFALQLLRQFGTRIGLPMEPEVLTRIEDRAELLISWLDDQGRYVGDFDAREVFGAIDLARAKSETAPLLDEWRDALAATGALDFPAMLDRACELMEGSWVQRQVQRLYQHVIVDEAQNLAPIQYELLRRIVGDPDRDHLNVMVVGDERQSIVTFAGADPMLMARFEDEYRAERIELTRNYRSAEQIIRVERSIASALNLPTEATDITFAAPGSVALAEADSGEAEGELVADWVFSLLDQGLVAESVAPVESVRVKPEEIAVLSRSGAALQNTRDALTSRGIESASASTEDDWVRSTEARFLVEVAAFNSAPNHRSTQRRMESLLGVKVDDWKTPQTVVVEAGYPSLAPLLSSESPMEMLDLARQIDPDDPDWLDDLRQLEEAMRLFLDRTSVSDRTFGSFRQQIVRCQRGDSLDPGVRLLTVHKAQGREFRAVAVVACNDGQFPDFRARTEEQLTSELRTFYVAVSRPTRMLLITRARSRSTRIGSRSTSPSRFLDYIPWDELNS